MRKPLDNVKSLNPFHASFRFTSIIFHSCIWSEMTDVSLKMTSNILQYLQIANYIYPLTTATAETSWKNSFYLLFLLPNSFCYPRSILLNLYIYIYIYIYSPNNLNVCSAKNCSYFGTFVIQWQFMLCI